MRLLILFFAVLVAVLPAHADEKRLTYLVSFDEAIQRFARVACGIAPKKGHLLGQVKVTIWALADDNGAVKTRYVALRQCTRYKPNAGDPPAQWPELPVVQTPKGDDRPEWTIAFDHGVQTLLGNGRCSVKVRPSGLGRFKGAEFSVQATIANDGILRTNWVSNIGCDWHPLTPSG